MNQDLDRHIKKRIAIISRGRKGDRDNLQEHIHTAAEDLAGDSPVSVKHIDDAFDILGTAAEIREAFFPKRTQILHAWAIVAYATSTLLAALDAFSSKSARCSGDGVIRCTVTAGDGLGVSLLSVMPPLVVLAAHFVGPKWLPTVFAVAWVLLFVLPAVADAGLARNVGLVAAGVITTTVSTVVWRRGASQ